MRDGFTFQGLTRQNLLSSWAHFPFILSHSGWLHWRSLLSMSVIQYFWGDSNPACLQTAQLGGYSERFLWHAVQSGPNYRPALPSTFPSTSPYTMEVRVPDRRSPSLIGGSNMVDHPVCPWERNTLLLRSSAFAPTIPLSSFPQAAPPIPDARGGGVRERPPSRAHIFKYPPNYSPCYTSADAHRDILALHGSGSCTSNHGSLWVWYVQRWGMEPKGAWFASSTV